MSTANLLARAYDFFLERIRP